nr:hypothetical protein [uncultured Flavobacterium sp.]
MKKNKTIKIALIIFVLLSAFLVASNFIWLNPRETIFYKIEQYVTYDKEDWKNYEEFEASLKESKVDNSMDIPTSEAATPQARLHPVNIGLFEESEKEAEKLRIKNAHFENLVVAKSAPDDYEAQTALVQFTNGQLTDVIINQKLNIKIGKCYTNPNKDGNSSCISCMILLYNRDTKDWQEAPMGKNFMENAYDFYQASEGDFWQAKDLSMNIPYDYDLIKKYELKEE